MVTQWMTEIVAIAVALLYVIAIVSAIEAILKARTSQGAIAWTISLLTLPFITVPAYLVLGRNRFDGYLEKRDEIEKEALRLIRRTSDSIQDQIVPASAASPLYSSLLKLARMPATRDNTVDLLIDGKETFDSIFSGIQQAQHYILLQFYIIRDDPTGKKLARELAEKAKAGIKVYVLYDEIGSRRFSKSRLHKQLEMTGVLVAPFNTTQGRRNRFQLNFRNHRKVVVVDGRHAWVGGHNVGDEYLGLDPKIGQWRDTHTRVTGPAVLGAKQAFATDWLWATNSHLEIDWNLTSKSDGNSTVLVFPSDPASEYEEAGLMFHQMIVAAQERIWIASPYFVPDRGIIAALQLAALRGVDVRILIPDEPDGPVVAMANWSYTRDLLPVGVQFFRYQGGFMHQKVMLVDDNLAGVGTANFDNRSFRLNFEITLLVEDLVFSRKIESMLHEDFGRSRQVNLSEFDNKPLWFILGMAVARLFSPIL